MRAMAPVALLRRCSRRAAHHAPSRHRVSDAHRDPVTTVTAWRPRRRTAQGLGTIALLYAVGFWNVHVDGLIFVSDSAAGPIQRGLAQHAAHGSASLPIPVVYPFAQKFFAKGVLAGSIKG